jgi:subtilase family serine protease
MASAVLSGAATQAGIPFAGATTPAAVDRGELASLDATPLSVTIALHLPKLAEAESLLQSLSTKGDPQYHRFLTADQFVARFAPADTDVAKVVASLAKYGLSAERATATTLRVTGSVANMERAFAVSLHSYTVPAHDRVGSYSYHAPLSRPTIPAEIVGAVAGVLGLDTRPSLRPLHVAAPLKLARRPAAKEATTGNEFGFLTVSDFAAQYDVKPLYRHGISGKGRTLGIMTFASLTPSDPFAYWKAVGLSVDPNRLRIVDIDGGPGAPSDESGSIETTLDVEQSGGIAPAARIFVYQGPNTNQGFVDVIAAAVDVNSAETLSISWGFWEWFSNLENSPVTDPVSGRTVGSLQATHELLLRAALQGQTVFAAAGDGGAYDLNNDLGCYGPYSSTQPDSCSLTLSVDYPASDTAITAAGGTTLAGTQDYCLNAACTPPYYVIDLPHQQVWGWDYLNGFCAAIGYPTPIACGTFPGGGGGGVSVLSEKPIYQFGVPGTQVSQPGQVYQAGEEIGTDFEVGLYYALPSYYAGRNVPDVSFDADPETGYVIYYTSEPSGVFGEHTFYGGTSFVAPQLNGVTALLGEVVDGRIGLLNFPLYESAAISRIFRGSAATVHPIAYGDNWFYHGSNGYNPAAGLGTLDVANFAKFLSSEFEGRTK